MTYRAHVCARYGDYQDLRIRRFESMRPSANEVLVQNRAFAVGFPDLLTIQGKYQRKPDVPFTPGSEFSGEVIAVGSDVRDVRSGDAVMGSVLLGAYAEQVIAPESTCFQLPKPFNFVDGAAFQVAYRTAYVALVERGQLKAGETLLVLGAAGGVGLAAVELGKALGAKVIAGASSEAKLALTKTMGADQTINYATRKLSAEVKKMTDGRGVDVVFDPVGGDLFDDATHCIAAFGRILVIGFASGRIPQLAVNYALIKQISIVGVRAGEFGRLDPAGGRRVNDALLRLANDNKFHPHVHGQFAFEAIEEIFRLMIAREINGRAVAVIG
ncbi:MAG: NADPH2:quinone reductase [Gammaproteobacteria bacterium]|jgi:NADPH2:quinone reductase